MECYRARPVRTREQKIAYMREWHRGVKADVFGHYGGYRCVCCGETEPVFLVIDHVNGGGNAERRKIGPQGTRGGAGQYWMLKKAGYPSGYQVLCHNCNFARIRGVCPHARQD